MHTEDWRDLGVCLRQITNLAEGKRVLYAGLTNSLCVRRGPGKTKISSKRKVKEHFLTTGHSNISGTSCSCVGRKEHLVVVQDKDAKKASGWQSPGSLGSIPMFFPNLIQVRCRICSKTWLEVFAFADWIRFLFESGCGTFSTVTMISISYPPLNSPKTLPKGFWHLPGAQ